MWQCEMRYYYNFTVLFLLKDRFLQSEIDQSPLVPDILMQNIIFVSKYALIATEASILKPF